MQAKNEVKIAQTLEALKAKVISIHKGFYPEKILKDLGKYGLYRSFYDNKEKGLFEAIESIAQVSRICGNTGFCVWCQEVLVWYLLHATHHNEALFAKASFGEILGGTGLSNPIKSFANIEKIKLSARKTEGGYIINGSLPWVSNIEYGHYFGAIAKVESSELDSASKADSSDFVMGLIECAKDKVKLKDDIKFCALEGSATKSVILKEYFLSEEAIISDPAKALLPRIMPGFILLQAGIALGLCECGIQELSKAKSEINQFLPKDVAYFTQAKNELVNRAKKACDRALDESKESLQIALLLKKDFAHLTLEIANAVMMACGTKGYLQDSLASKLLIESYFVAIVTPSLKHIAKITA